MTAKPTVSGLGIDLAAQAWRRSGHGDGSIEVAFVPGAGPGGPGTARVEWVRDNGRPTPRNVPGSEQVFPAQLLLLALGFSGPESQLLDQLGVEKDGRSNAKAEHGKFVTSLPGVFAAGDMRRGQSLVVWAINEGRGAARECDRHLMGRTDLP